MKPFLVAALTGMILFGPGAGEPRGGEAPALNAPICAKCHEEESNKMMGFLKNVAFKSHTILLDLLTHKEVVRFGDDTRFKNLESLADMRNYKGKGFRIYFAEENGAKYAVHITRFDILQLVDDRDKLNRQQVLDLIRSSSPVLVDVRPQRHFQAAHIPGAINVPAPAFEKFKTRLPEDKKTPLVIYGAGGCLSPSVAVNAMAMGYSDVRVYTGGFPDWVKAGYGVTTRGFVKQGLADHAIILLDLRNPALAAREHIPGAVSAPPARLERLEKSLEDALEDRKSAPIVLFGPDSDAAARELITRGLRGVRLLPGNLAAWKKAGGPVTRGPLASKIVYTPKARPGVIPPAEFRKSVSRAGADLELIDVRHFDEFMAGHIAGSINIPVDELEGELARLNRDKEIVVYCNSGVRAEMAYNLLRNRGFRVRYLDAIIKFKPDSSFVIEEN